MCNRVLAVALVPSFLAMFFLSRVWYTLRIQTLERNITFELCLMAFAGLAKDEYRWSELHANTRYYR